MPLPLPTPLPQPMVTYSDDCAHAVPTRPRCLEVRDKSSVMYVREGDSFVLPSARPVTDEWQHITISDNHFEGGAVQGIVYVPPGVYGESVHAASPAVRSFLPLFLWLLLAGVALCVLVPFVAGVCSTLRREGWRLRLSWRRSTIRADLELERELSIAGYKLSSIAYEEAELWKEKARRERLVLNPVAWAAQAKPRLQSSYRPDPQQLYAQRMASQQQAVHSETGAPNVLGMLGIGGLF